MAALIVAVRGAVLQAVLLGLAATPSHTAVVWAALGMPQASLRWSGFDTFMWRAPYASGALIICVGVYVGIHALSQIAGS